MRLRNMKNKKEILNSSKNVLENFDNIKGNWNKEFGNDNPIRLEIGVGRCNFIIENAKRYKDINFVGIERIDTVLAQGVKKIDTYMPNLRLINYDANLLNNIFDKEIDVLYLNFSDPWPKDRHSKRRLTHERFLKIYDNLFKNTKNIIIKTDNRNLFEFSIVSLSNYGYIINEISLDLQNDENNDNIVTEYEDKFTKQGSKIYRLVAQKN